MNSRFNEGDFIVEKSMVDLSTELILYKIVEIEEITPKSSLWIEGIDDENYLLYHVETVKVFPHRTIRKRERTWFLYDEILTLNEYLNKPFQVQDYIDVCYNNKDIYDAD